MEKNKKALAQWLYWFLFAVSVIAVYKVLDNFSDITNWIKNLIDVLMPFIVGILIAYLLYLPAKSIEKFYLKRKFKFIKNKARVLSVFTVYIIALLIIILAMNFIIPTIIQSVTDLFNNIGQYYETGIKMLEDLENENLAQTIDLQKIIDNLKNINIEQYFNLEAITQYAKSAIGIVNSVFDVFVSIIVSIYILIERRAILEFFKKLSKAMFNKKTYNTLAQYFNSSNIIFFRFISSQVLDAVIVGILTSIAMSLLGVKYAVLLGVIIGISNLIPYFGAIVGVIIAIIITMVTGGITQSIWLAIIVIILQQIDANIINPKIVGNSLKISPLLVIFSVTVGGAYFGIWGMFLSVPVFAIIKLYIEDYIDYKNEA